MPSSQPETKPELPPIPAAADSSGLPTANPVPDVGAIAADKENKAKEKQKSSLEFKKVIRSYLVPLAVLAIFAAMLIFLIIPKISEIVDHLDQTNSLYDQARSMDNEITTLNTLNQSTDEFNADLGLINQIAPSGATEVVNFQKKIIDLSAQDNLSVQQSNLAESIKQAEDKTSTSSLGIVEIPSTFSLRGNFNDLQNFVTQIRGLNDFVIIGEMSLRSNLDPNVVGDGTIGPLDDWTLTITLIKYQFLEPNAQNQLALVFQNVPAESVITQSVVDFAKNKFATSDQTTTTDQSQNSTTTP